MKLRSANCAVWAAVCLLAVGVRWSAAGPALRLAIVPRYNAAALVFGKPAQTNAAAQEFSVTRLDFLLSDFALHRSGGAWLQTTNWQACVKLGENCSNAAVDGLEPGAYDRIRFHVGLTPELNHSDPALYPPGHPLNPNLNGLHWGWAGGYVFFALEGLWRDERSQWRGYSFHLGNDPQLMTVDLPVALELGGDKSLVLTLDLDGLFARKLGEDNASTHSRKGDELASSLRVEVEKAFAVAGVGPASAPTPAGQPRLDPEQPQAATHPYRFTFSMRFPRPDLPLDNPLTQEGVELGRRLFFEKKLSINDRQSCASCHQPEHAFSDAGKRFSAGAEGAAGTRNAMGLFNLAWKRSFFWDGRAATLRQQVLMPIQNSVEMHQSLDKVIAKLAATTEYPALFAAAFGGPGITANRLALALEQFVLTRISCNSKLDRALQGAEELTDEEKRGFELFMTEYDPRRGLRGADCFHCHGGPLFQSQGFANNGLDAVFADLGRGAVTGREWDNGRFAVPSLRNVELTGPYMHDGRFKTLEEVVAHYCTGVKRSATLDPNLAKHPDGGVPLSGAEQKALVAFLKTLTEESLRVEQGSGQLTKN
jgi:cytochrome c peroxidase